MKPVVFISKPIPSEVEAFIGLHCQIKKWCEATPIPRQFLLEQMADVQGLLGVGIQINEELIRHAPVLKVASNITVGYNNFDLVAMKVHGIMGTNTPEVLDETVADLVFGLILSSARRIAELDYYVKQGSWQKSDAEKLFGIDVHHATLGIIGMGRIGEAIARRAKLGFQMEVMYSNRNRKLDVENALGVRFSPLDDLLKTADFIVLMTPLTTETRHLIGPVQFSLMRPSAIFINASRGETVDENALVDALQNRKIRAAGLDVFDREPINAEHPLLKMPNVLTLPHIGSATTKTRFDMAMLAAQNMVCALKGEIPKNLVVELK